MHKTLELYGKFGRSNLLRAINKRTGQPLVLNEIDSIAGTKRVPKEVWNMIRLTTSSMEIVPTMIDCLHFAEGSYLAFKCETLYNYTLKQAIE